LLAISERGVGASTGYIRAHRGDWPALLQEALQVSSRAVELSALSAFELPSLEGFLAENPGLSFEYVAVHGPAKGWQDSDRQLVARLSQLPDQVVGLVIHPDTIHEKSAFRALGRRLLLENMDTQKLTGRTVRELAPYFRALPDAGFCFDVAHAYQCDPTLQLAHDLLDAFSPRLGHVHLSSILDNGTHVPLRAEDASLFSPVLERCVMVPWILEAPVSSLRCGSLYGSKS
jgi:hypothetical protein